MVPLSTHARVSESAAQFEQHVRDLHKEISQKINLNNEIYQKLANSRKRAKEFNLGDYVKIRLRPKRFPSGTLKKLHARGAGPFKMIKRIGSNAYVLELPPELGISSTFNISVLTEHREPAMIPSEPFEPVPIFESETNPECPPTNWPERRERIERILDDQAISTQNRNYQCYLVRWQGRPESEDSWITREDLQCMDLDILKKYQSQIDPYSTGSSSSHPGRIDVGTRIRKRLQPIQAHSESLWLD